MESLSGTHVTGSWQLEPNKNPGSDTLQYVALGEAVGGRMNYSTGVDSWAWTQFTCWVELKSIAGYMCAAMKLDHLTLQDIPVNDNQKKVWKWWEIRPCLVTLVVIWRRVVVIKTKRISLFVFFPELWAGGSIISVLLAYYFPLSCARMLNLRAFMKMLWGGHLVKPTVNTPVQMLIRLWCLPSFWRGRRAPGSAPCSQMHQSGSHHLVFHFTWMGCFLILESELSPICQEKYWKFWGFWQHSHDLWIVRCGCVRAHA